MTTRIVPLDPTADDHGVYSSRSMGWLNTPLLYRATKAECVEFRRAWESDDSGSSRGRLMQMIRPRRRK